LGRDEELEFEELEELEGAGALAGAELGGG